MNQQWTIWSNCSDLTRPHLNMREEIIMLMMNPIGEKNAYILLPMLPKKPTKKRDPGSLFAVKKVLNPGDLVGKTKGVPFEGWVFRCMLFSRRQVVEIYSSGTGGKPEKNGGEKNPGSVPKLIETFRAILGHSIHGTGILYTYIYQNLP